MASLINTPTLLSLSLSLSLSSSIINHKHKQSSLKLNISLLSLSLVLLTSSSNNDLNSEETLTNKGPPPFIHINSNSKPLSHLHFSKSRKGHRQPLSLSFMSSNKKTQLHILTTTTGCKCGRPKLSDVYEPTPKPKTSISYNNMKPIIQNLIPSSHTCFSCTSPDDEDFTSTTISEAETDKKSMNMAKRSPMMIDSIAVEKDSGDPYKDFRHSMLQMIFEKEICSEKDLQELLECFLELNTKCLHEVIVRVFREICEEVFAKKKKKVRGEVGGGPVVTRKKNARAS